jgi:hypothetical protein
MTNNDFLKEIELNIDQQIKDGIKEAVEQVTAENIKINIAITAK